MDVYTPPPLVPQGDEAVQNTTDDAASSKLSAANFGYFDDPYLTHFVAKKTRRAPLINRGYYARVDAIRQSITRFMEIFANESTVQIVSFGSGLDTSFFWVYEKWKNISFYEIDFPEVIKKKSKIICQTPDLWKFITPNLDELNVKNSGEMDTQNFTMIACDLRECKKMNDLIFQTAFDPSLPTLFMCECVLVYIKTNFSDQLIKWSAEICSGPSAILVYEQTNPHDPFGSTMMNNLKARGCPLLGLLTYPSLQSQQERYNRLSWDETLITDMNTYYLKSIPHTELRRIEKIELFDELEEWTIIQNHYFILIALHYSKEGKGSYNDFDKIREIIHNRN